jgi:excinuclease ABC subunit A
MAKKDAKRIQFTETVYSIKRACPCCNKSFPELDPRLFSYNSKHGWCATCFGTGLSLEKVDWDEEREKTGTEEHVLDSWLNWLEVDEPCPTCSGKRLNPTALAVRYRKRSIAELAALPVAKLAGEFTDVSFSGREAAIARDIVTEIRSRLSFLDEVGLGYLALDRAAPTLSGGEAQRIRLAAQLGSNLRGVAYILDEPTIGLHPRDNQILLNTLAKLQTKGNTLIVVEHDEDTIRRADHVIDLGPGAGRLGGYVVAAGTAAELQANPQSVTGRLLAKPLQHPLYPPRKVDAKTPSLLVRDAQLHNLQRVQARVPLGRLTVVTGVSGSGKSTLARDVLHANLVRLVNNKTKSAIKTTGCKEIAGWDAVGRVLEVDQTPIGKTPRSCPATYVGFWDTIRRLYAEAPEARMRGYTASRFSFNTKGGRCEACEGQGLKKIEMHFLPDVFVECEVCRGKRYNRETLEILYRNKSIADVLDMTIEQSLGFFENHPKILRFLKCLHDVGLDYLTLGQPSTQLSGGEAQRIKLATELGKTFGALEQVELLKAGSAAPPADEEAEAGDALDEFADAAGPAKNKKGGKDAKKSSKWAERFEAMRQRAANPYGKTLYVLDEPTTGLHFEDIRKLVHVFDRLADAGHTLVVIEHNLDVIKCADWIIDLGPEGGSNGGTIVAQGTPETVAKSKGSFTGAYLGPMVKPK